MTANGAARRRWQWKAEAFLAGLAVDGARKVLFVVAAIDFFSQKCGELARDEAPSCSRNRATGTSFNSPQAGTGRTGNRPGNDCR